MAARMLDEVLEKEKRASEKELEAKAEAQRIIDEAERRAAEIVRNAELEAQKKSDEMFEAAQREAEKLSADARTEALDKIAGLKQTADNRFSEAVGRVKEIISE